MIRSFASSNTLIREFYEAPEFSSAAIRNADQNTVNSEPSASYTLQLLEDLVDDIFESVPFGALKSDSPIDPKSLRINGGDDGARTRDLCRDRAAL